MGIEEGLGAYHTIVIEILQGFRHLELTVQCFGACSHYDYDHDCDESLLVLCFYSLQTLGAVNLACLAAPSARAHYDKVMSVTSSIHLIAIVLSTDAYVKPATPNPTS